VAEPGPLPGGYVLVLRARRRRRIVVGRLGTYEIVRGCYAYVGSAFGPGGLAARLRRHRDPARRPHWHVDRLGEAAELVEIWWGEQRLPREHEWAALLSSLPGAAPAIPRFGASDCRCPTHLFRFARRPDATRFARRVRGRFPGDGRLGRIVVRG
jgi:Uri superfamily endonuclease